MGFIVCFFQCIYYRDRNEKYKKKYKTFTKKLFYYNYILFQVSYLIRIYIINKFMLLVVQCLSVLGHFDLYFIVQFLQDFVKISMASSNLKEFWVISKICVRHY